MSVMEKRLQLLLDQHRYELVSREAESSGRSVAAVIREAIDQRFDDEQATRAAAARRFLECTEDEYYPVDWAQEKRLMDEELDEKFDRTS